MKYFTLLTLLFLQVTISAQKSDKESVQECIETFFNGFHQQDSTIVKQTVWEGIVLQTIATDSVGNNVVDTEDFSAFIKSIVGIPKTTRFQEVIKGFTIQIDGPMANAWTPYEFRVNDAFHHCGVNSFQLVKQGQEWKIVYLIDTRRKTGCD
tara:strand:- start:1287 stop:1742 length:456 start_codon:yes stop_codon:yes gene_type:complete